MKMSDQLAHAFNAQIGTELSSSIAYLQMSAHFSTENLVGMASWMRRQAEEERQHAHRFLDFVLNRGNQVRIGPLDAPSSDFESVEQVFAIALQQEQLVTKAIHDLYRMAGDEGDLASLPILQAFIAEQNEEESMVETILERVRLAGDEPSSMFLLDSELGSRA